MHEKNKVETFSGCFRHLSLDVSVAIMPRFLLPSLSATLLLSQLRKFALKTQDIAAEVSEDLI